MKQITLLFFSLTWNFAWAHIPQEGLLHISAGPYVHQTHLRNAQDTGNNPIRVGFGITAEGDLNENGGVEAGFFYFLKTYERQYGDLHMVESVHKIETPLGYRWWITDRVSAALLFTAAYSIGETHTLHNDVGAANETTSARDITDYGLQFSTQWELWTTKEYAMVFDARYTHSLFPKHNEDANVYGGMLVLKKRLRN